MSKPPHNSTPKKTAMLQALEKSLGVVTTACRSIGIDRGTHYDWYNSDEDYKRKVDELDNIALDFAESQLHQQMKNGQPSSTIFYLKTKGKRRGYVEGDYEPPNTRDRKTTFDLGGGNTFEI